MDIIFNNTIVGKKTQLLSYFRDRTNESFEEISREYSTKQYKQKASAINKAINETKNKLLLTLSQRALEQNWAKEDILNSVLQITYCANVTMLDFRNSIWLYDYMAFSRRIGELWEPFCKLCFEHSLKKLELYIPPLFSDVKKMMSNEIEAYIDKLTIENKQKLELKNIMKKFGTWSHLVK